jgi:hypothetical protein
MKKEIKTLNLLLFLISSFLFICLLSLKINASYSLDSNHFDLGRIDLATKNIARFTITNNGKSILYVKKIESDCDCTVANVSRRIALPGQSIVVNATYSGNTKGFFQRLIIVKMNIKKKYLILKITGYQVYVS